MPLDVHEVEEKAAAKILALNSDTALMSLFTQGNSTTAAWREVRQLGIEPTSTAGVAHLSFHAFVEASPVTEMARGSSGDVAMVRSRLTVMFTYHCRSDAQIADSRLARRAAKAVFKALNARDQDWMCLPVDAGQFMLTDTDRPSVVMRVLFDILHEMEA